MRGKAEVMELTGGRSTSHDTGACPWLNQTNMAVERFARSINGGMEGT